MISATLLPVLNSRLAVETQHQPTTASTPSKSSISSQFTKFKSIPHRPICKECNLEVKILPCQYIQTVVNISEKLEAQDHPSQSCSYLICIKGISFRIVTNLYFVWPNHCTMKRRAIKVSYSFHHAIMFSQWLIILNSNPKTRR